MSANAALGFVFAEPDEFLWILSDNDHVGSCAVEKILNMLCSNVDLFAVSFHVAEKQSYTVRFDAHWDFLFATFGLISGAVYNMKTFGPFIENAFNYHNSCYPHLAVLFSAIKSVGPLKAIVTPYYELFIGPDLRAQGDYSLAVVGKFILATLMPVNFARQFCWNFLLNNGLYFYRYKDKHYLTYLQSKAVLSSLGFRFRIALRFFGLTEKLVTVMPPFIKRLIIRNEWLLMKWKTFLTSIEGIF